MRIFVISKRTENIPLAKFKLVFESVAYRTLKNMLTSFIALQISSLDISTVRKT